MIGGRINEWWAGSGQGSYDLFSNTGGMNPSSAGGGGGGGGAGRAPVGIGEAVRDPAAEDTGFGGGAGGRFGS